MSRLVPCKISDGMFSDERIIWFSSRGGISESFVVESDLIEKMTGENHGLIRVNVINSGGREVAILPTNRRDIVNLSEIYG